MRGHNPLGWAATLLIAVAYAHVLLELAGAVLAVAVAVRLLVASPIREALRARRYDWLGWSRWPVALVIERRPAREPDRQRSRPRVTLTAPRRGARRASRRPEDARPILGNDNELQRASEGDEMIEISVSSEMAAEHSRFMAECAERGHRVEVFESGGEAHEPACCAQAKARAEVPTAADQATEQG